MATPPTTTVSAVLLVDQRIQDYETIVSAVKSDVRCIVFDANQVSEACSQQSITSFQCILNKITELGVTSFANIGIVQHNRNTPLHQFFGINPTELSTVAGVETSDPTLQTWTGFAGFITSLKPTYGVQNVDLMACALYSNPDWKYVIDTLATQTGVEIRASTDNTGAAAQGGNWFLESHTGVNLKGVYFTDAIEEYRGVLYLTPFNIREYSTKGFATGSIQAWGASGQGGTTPGNVTSGVVAVYSTAYGAFAALKTDGSVVAWGSSVNGGTDPGITSGVVAVYSTYNAFAALKTDGSIVAWGSSVNGGTAPSTVTASNSGVVAVYSTSSAFAALKSNGSIVAWGDSSYGGTTPGNVTSGVVAVYSTNGAFAALKTDGSVVAWGYGPYGGTDPGITSGVVAVYSTDNAFAALKTNGSIVAWGINGGTAPSTVTASNSGVVAVYSTGGAFAALKTDGSVVAWGDSSYGGTTPGNVTSGIVAVYSTDSAFAVLKTDGSVVAWGNYGGTAPSNVTASNSGVVSIYSVGHAFAALKTDGSIVTWGYGPYGGTDPGITSGVVAVYSTNVAFAALKSDGSVVAWGSESNGGTNPGITSGVGAVYSNIYAFAALKTTAETFDLSFSYYSNMDRYDILRKKENRRRVNLTTLNQNVFTLSAARDIQSFNPTMPTDRTLRIIVPTYVSSPHSITSTATIPSGAGSVIIACDEGEPVTISGVTYVNLGSYVYKRETNNTYTKLTTVQTISGVSYMMYGGDGVNSSGIALIVYIIPTYGAFTPPAKTFGDASFSMVSFAPTTDSSGAYTYTSSAPSVATISSDGTVVTIIGQGSATITASQDICGNYAAGSQTGTLTIARMAPTYGAFTPPAKTFGDAAFSMVSFAPTTDSSGAYTYTSSAPEVATINSAGTVVTIIGYGSTTITASQDICGNYLAGSQTGTLTVTRKVPTYGAFTPPAKTILDTSFSMVSFAPTTDSSGAYTYTSSAPEVATISSDGTVVGIVGLGSTTITVSQDICGNYLASSQTGTFTITRKVPTYGTFTPPAKMIVDASFSMVPFAPTTDSSGVYTYTSSAPGVATINSDGTVVGIVSQGSTTITVSQDICGNYAASSQTGTLTIAGIVPTYGAFTPPAKTFGDASFSMVSFAPTTDSAGVYIYTSSAPSVATISSDGTVVTIIGQGSATITASQDICGNYAASSQTGTLTIARMAPTYGAFTPPAKTILDTSFSMVSFAPTTDSSGAYTYTSSAPEVATINSAGTVVGIVGLGSTTITASQDICGNYLAGSQTGTLTITRKVPTYGAFTPPAKTFGDTSFSIVSFAPTSESIAAYTYTSSAPEVATINSDGTVVIIIGQGSTTITASQQDICGNYAASSQTGTLTVARKATTYGAFTPPAKTFGDASFSMVPFAPTSDSSGVYTYTSATLVTALSTSISASWYSISMSSTGQYRSAVIYGGNILTSSDYGVTWTARTAPGSLYWWAISLSSTGQYQSAVVYNGGNIWTSSDYGVTWTSRATSLGWRSVSLSSTGQYQSAVVAVGYIWCSIDYGVTWTSRATNLAWISISLSSTGQYQSAADNGNGYLGQIWTSSDFGVTWTARTAIPTGDTASISLSYTGQYQSAVVTRGNIWISSDYGVTWTARTAPGILQWSSVSLSSTGQYQSAVVDGVGGGTGGYIWSSSDYGVTWTSRTAPGNLAWKSISSSSTGQYQSAVVYNNGNIWASSDFGVTWYLYASYYDEVNVSNVATISSDGTVVTIVGRGTARITASQDICGNYLAGSKTGLLNIAGMAVTYGAFTPPAKTFGDAAFSMVPFAPTTDSSGVYTYASSSLVTATSTSTSGSWFSISLSSTGQYRSAVIQYGNIWTSSDYGVTWTARTAPGSLGWTYISLSSTGQYQSACGVGGNIWTSSDYGVTWTSRATSLGWNSISLSYTGRYQSAVVQNGNIWTSSDYGVTWTVRPAAGGLQQWYSISLSSTGQYQSAVVYNSTGGGGGNIWTSSDYGVTWTSRATSLYWRSISSSATGQYQSAVSQYIWTSSDYGVTWTSRATGLQWYSISLSSTGQYQSAVAYSGNIWTSSDYGVTWTSRATSLAWLSISLSSTGQYQSAAVGAGNIWTSIDFGVTWSLYASSSSVATISSDGTVVIICGQGTATITASQDICGNYGVGSQTGTLTVARKVPSYYDAFTPPAKTFGDASFSMVPFEPISESIAAYTYTSSAPEVATISSDGTVVTIIGQGSTTITASQQDICGNYLAGSQTGTLTVARKAATYSAFTPPAKTFGDASFSMVPFAPTSDSSGVYTYTSASLVTATSTSTSGNWRSVSLSSTGQYRSAAAYSSSNIWTSSDYGVTWTVRTAPGSRYWNSISLSSTGQYQSAVANAGSIWTSSDYGVTWTERTAPGTQNWYSISLSSTGQYQSAVVQNSSFGNIWTSSDYGVTWTARTAPGTRDWNSISLSSTGQYQSTVVYGGNIWTSSDYGVTWTSRATSLGWNSISSSSTGQYQSAVVNGGYSIWTSSDYGVTWTSLNESGVLNSISLSSTGQYRSAVVSGGNIRTSSDYGVTWTERTAPGTRDWYSISLSSTGQYQSAVVYGGNIWTSIDFGVTWSQYASYYDEVNVSNIATISSDGTVVTIVGRGTARITVSQDICGNYAASSKTGTLTIAGMAVTYGAFTPPAKTFGDASFSMVPFAPTTDSSGAYTYTSSAPSVATISSDGTVVTIIGQGSATITASQDICGNYGVGSQTGTLTIARKAPVYGAFTPPAKTFGDASFSIVSFAPTSESSGAYTYTSSAPEVATINSAGTVVTIIGQGSTTITASQDICGNYLAGSQTGTLTVARKAATYSAFTPPAKTFGDASFSMVPFAPTSDSSGVYTYTSATLVTATSMSTSASWYSISLSSTGQYRSAVVQSSNIWTSSDFGVTWIARTAPGLSLGWWSISLSSTGQYQSATVNGGNIWTSSDYGVTWTARTAAGTRDWYTISLSSTGQYQSATVPSGNIWMSSDFGVTWTAITAPGTRVWVSISLSSTGQYQSAVIENGNIWTSSDYGVTWASRATSLSWRSISVSSTGLYQSAVVNPGYIWTSSDYGVTWTSRTAPGSLVWRSISLSSTGQYQCAVASNSNIWISTDYGVTWTARTAPGTRIWVSISLSSTGQYQSVVVNNGGTIWSSSDFGVTWSQYASYYDEVNVSNVATISSDGTVVTIVGRGTAGITVSQDICGNYAASSKTGTLTIAGMAVTYGAFTPPAKTFGDASFSMVPFAPTTDSSGVYTYTSSAPSVATISSDGTVVTIIGQGTATITASQDICGNYGVGSQTGTLTVARKAPVYGAFTPPPKTFGNAAFSMVSFAPTTESTGAYTYTSSAPEVATINSAGTVVTIIGQGSTTITASQDICGNYLAGSQTGTLTVARKVPVYGAFTPPAKTILDTSFSMVPFAPTTESSGVYTYTSSAPEVATISSDGTVVGIVGLGSTTITVSQDICGNYLASSKTGTFTITRKVPVYGEFTPPAKTFGDASFSMVPFAPTSESSGVYTYTSSAPSVATISSDGTVVTIIGQGSATITASQDICGNYQASSKTGTLTIARLAPTYGAFTPPAKTFGDAAFSIVSFAPSTDSSGAYTYTSSNTSVATINSTGTVVTIIGQGASTITASQDICGNYLAGSQTGTLTVARKVPAYGAFNPPAKIFGDASFSMVPFAPTTESIAVYTYTSSAPEVATINSTGTVVTIISQGSTTITASQQDICGNYLTGSQTGTLTVARKGTTYGAFTPPAKTFGDASFSIVPFAPTTDSSGVYTYTSATLVTATSTSTSGNWFSISLSSTGQYRSAVVYGGNIWTSSDYGVTWTARTAPGSLNWARISVSSTGQYQSAVGNGIYIWTSSDYGVTWTARTAPGNQTWYWIYLSSTGQYQSATAAGYIWTSSDFGVTWTARTAPGNRTWVCISLSSTGQYQSATVSGGYIWTSSDYGVTWTSRTAPGSLNWWAISVSSTGQYQSTLANSNYIWTSSDYGVTWTARTAPGILYWFSISLSSTGQYQTALGTPGYIWTSSDYGVTWTARTAPGSLNWYSISLSSNGQYQSTVVQGSGTIWASSDYGVTWSQYASYYDEVNVSNIATISSDGTVVTIVGRGTAGIMASQDICGNYLAGSKTGVLTIAGMAVTYGAFTPPAKTFGDAAFSMVPFAPTTDSSGVYTYTSSAPSVATISSDGTVVTIVGQGTATITASQDICGNYAVGSQTGTLTIARKAPVYGVFTPPAKTFGNAAFSMVSFAPTTESTGAYTYTSSAPEVATINSAGTVVTIIGQGSTTITASQDICGNYLAGSQTGTFTVARKVPVYGAFTPPAKTFGDASFSIVSFAPTSESTGAYTYTSSAPEVATISSDGTVVTVIGQGSTTITASQDICGNYQASSKTGTLTVARKVPVYGTFTPPAKTFGDASFSIVSYAPTSESSGVYTYTSSAPSVATISSDGTVVTVIGQGSATITASQDICGNYTASSKTGTLTIARLAPTYGAFTPPAKTFGNAPFSMVSFAPTTDSTGAYTYTSSAPEVATINSAGTVVTIIGQGSTTITASQDICGNYLAGSQTGTLTVARKVPAYGAFTPPAKTFGDASFSMVSFAPTSESIAVYTYTSSAPEVATISSDGTVVTIISQGSTTITASQQDICGNYLTGSQTGTLTVARKLPAYGAFTPPIKTFGDASFSMVSYAPTSESIATYTYTSSAPSVATISSDGTVVTIIGQGSATITTSQDICGNYAASSATGVLTVNRAAPTFLKAFTITNKTFGDAPFSLLPFTEGLDNTDGTYHFSSSNPSIVSISTVDNVTATILAYTPTPITITVDIDACGNYAVATTSGALTVARAAPTYGAFNPPAKTFGDASFSMVSFAPTTNSTGAYIYTSSAPEVATISSNGTVVTIIGYGSTTITASQDICGNYLAGSQTGTLTITRKVPVYGAFTPPAKTFGDASFSMVSFAPTTESTGAYTYTSSAPEVATISSDGTVVTVIGQGASTITASQDICGNYLASSKTGTLTVARKVPVYGAFTPPAKTFGDASFSMVSFAPTTESSGVYTYTSSAPSVATISSDGTVVTIIGQGTATITASQDICGNYAASSQTGTLTVARKAITYGAFTPPAKTFGNAAFSMVSFAPTTDSTGAYTYTSSAPEVATISSDGTVVTVIGQGASTITASQDICGNYLAGSQTGTLTVARKVPVYGAFTPPAKTILDTSFSMVPFAPTTESSGVYTYTSSAPEVATISSDGTVVTIVGLGSTTITASQDICGNYQASSQTGTLTITRKVPVYGAFTPPAKTFGDASFSIVSFAPTSESSGVYTYTSSAPSVATISSDGTVVTIIGQGAATITASQDICGNYQASSQTGTLTVARKAPVYGAFTPPAKTFGDAAFSMVSFAPTTESTGAYTYTSSNTSVATINSAGTVVTIIGQGYTTITASQDICGNYLAGSQTGTLTIALKLPVYGAFTPPTKTFGNAPFSMVSFAPTSESSGVYTYTSSAPEVATISSDGTVVTIIGQGAATITVSQDICGNYQASSKTATLTVVRKVPVYSAFTQPAKTFGDASFSMVPFAPTSESSGVYTYTSSAPSVATISSDGTVVTIISQGSTTIAVSQDICGNYTASSKTGTLTVARKVPVYGAFTPPAKTFGDASFSIVSFAPTTESSGVYTYTSSAPSVATISSDGTVVTVIGQGTATITASQDICGNYTASSKTGTLTVARKAITYGEYTLPTKTFGDASFSIVSFAPTTDSAGVYTYTSSAPSVATINSTGTVVTIIGQGTTTITASQDICGNYLASSISASLLVNRAAPTFLSAFTVNTMTFGDEPFSLLPFTVGLDNTDGTYHFSSSNSLLVSISGDTATILAYTPSPITITVDIDACGNYAASSTSGTLTVNRGPQTFQAVSPVIKTFDDAAFSLAPYMVGISNSSGSYTFASSNPSAISIGGDGVTATIHAYTPSAVTITASQAAAGNYAAGTKTFLLTVNRGTPTISGLTNLTKTMIDAPFTLSPTSNSNGTFSYVSDNSAIIFMTNSGTTFNMAGSGLANITATITQDTSGNYNTRNYNFTIAVGGGTSNLPAATFAVPASMAYDDTPVNIITTPMSNSDGALTYTSSNTNIATIHATTGVITAVAAGSVYFIATQAETSIYNSNSVNSNSMTVVVKVVTQSRVAPYTSSTITKYYGDAAFQIAAISESTASKSFSLNISSVVSLSTISNIANITINNVGTVIITGHQNTNSQYSTQNDLTWTLTVEKGTTALTGMAATLSKNVTDAPFTVAVTSASAGVKSYALSNPDSSNVLVVNSSTGVVTLKGAGTATIVASQAASSLYNAPPSISCVVTVAEAGTSLQGSAITSAQVFDNVNMTGASLSSTTVTSVSFAGATLTNVDLSGSTIRNSTLTTASLASATLTNADISGTSFAGATMTSAIMTRVTLTNSTLSSVSMAGASMADAIITGSTFASATMTNAVLTGATLTNSTLTSTILTGATLVGANVTGSTFVGASLASADMSGATVTNANFTNANISGANITNVAFSSLQKIQLLKNTNNRAIGGIQVSDISGSVVLAAISGSSAAASIPNISTADIKVVIPTTSTVVGDTLPNVVLDTTTSNKFYFPINEGEYFQILGVKYYTDAGIVKNATTNAVVDVITYGSKSIWLIAGSIIANVLTANTLSASTFTVPSSKMDTDTPFNITVTPTSNSDGTNVYSSNNTSVATIHPTTGLITIVGQGYVRFIATQAATLLYEAGSITSNELHVDKLVNFTLSGLNQTILLSTSGILDASAVSLDTTDATAVFYVKLSDMTDLFKFQTDSFDVNDLSATDLKYLVFNRKWPAALKINPAHSMLNKTESSGMLGSADTFVANKMLAKHDFIRYLSLKLFNTIHGVALFDNTADLLENMTYWGEDVRNNIRNILTGISTTSSDESMSYDVSGNKYLTNAVTTNTNLCRELMRQMAASAASRFGSSVNAITPQSVPFIENDSINFKVTFQSTSTQNVLTGVEVIPSRSYMVKLVMKTSITGLNTPVVDSEMYPNAYAYSSSVVSYAPTESSSAVYNIYSPPAPMPFARFGFDGWYYTNSSAWVISAARNHIKWLMPANSGSSTVGNLQYIRVNLKIHNKVALPYIMVYTQSGSSRKYTVTNTGALANGGVYSFYMNFNSYTREPAMISYTNAVMSNTTSSGSFANNELILNVALETDSGAGVGTVDFTLSSVIVGDASGEKEYGFEADVPTAYP